MRQLGGFGMLPRTLVGAGGLLGTITIGLCAMPATAAPSTAAAVARASATVPARFGNPAGHFHVPPPAAPSILGIPIT